MWSFRVLSSLENSWLLPPGAYIIHGSILGRFYIKITFSFQPDTHCRVYLAPHTTKGQLEVMGLSSLLPPEPRLEKQLSLQSLFPFVFHLSTKDLTLQVPTVELPWGLKRRGADLPSHFAEALGCVLSPCLSHACAGHWGHLVLRAAAVGSVLPYLMELCSLIMVGVSEGCPSFLLTMHSWRFLKI